MWRLIRAFGYLISGRFTDMWKTLNENKYVAQATFDKAIDQNRDRLTTVTNAIAELKMVELQRVDELRDLSERIEKLGTVSLGAKSMMQKRLDALKSAGKSKTEILTDPEFMKHKAAFDDASSTLSEVQKQYTDKEADLVDRQQQLVVYTNELQKMQRGIKSLEQEKHQVIADTAIAQQQEAINNALAGLAQNTVDKDLEAVRKAHKTAIARSKVSAHLAGADAELAENEYLAAAQSSKNNVELDALLDWGEDDSKTLEPAKIPDAS